MAKTKLALRIEEEAIARAKRLSRQSGKPVSKMVEDYFTAFEHGNDECESDAIHGPLTRSLYGILKGSNLTEQDYRDYLEEKYR